MLEALVERVTAPLFPVVWEEELALMGQLLVCPPEGALPLGALSAFPATPSSSRLLSRPPVQPPPRPPLPPQTRGS